MTDDEKRNMFFEQAEPYINKRVAVIARTESGATFKLTGVLQWHVLNKRVTDENDIFKRLKTEFVELYKVDGVLLYPELILSIEAAE